MQLKSLSLKDPAQNSLMSYNYDYSPAGNVNAKNTEQGNYIYQYDDLYRLTGADNGSSEVYAYDPVGNRRTSADVQGDWTYNGNNELLSYNGVTYEYDNNGNILSKTDQTGTTTFTYDIDNRLVQLLTPNSQLVTYYYDPFGKRLWKEVNGVRTYFFYSDEGLIGEYDASGVEIKTYGYAPNSTWTTDPLFQKIGGNYYWYQNDHLGTPQKIVDTNGRVVWSATYDSFAKAQIQVAEIENNLRFPGQYHDKETGLHHNWNRYYDPRTGRYITIDPIRLDDVSNLFLYAEDNPIINLDPSGLFPCYCKEFISEAEGAKIAEEAKGWRGTAYKKRGRTKDGADCTGSTWQIYNKTGNSYVSLRDLMTAREFNEVSTNCKMQAVQSPQIGDVVKFSAQGHIAIYDPTIGTTSKSKGKDVKDVLWTTHGTPDEPGEYGTGPLEHFKGSPTYYRFCKKPCVTER